MIVNFSISTQTALARVEPLVLYSQIKLSVMVDKPTHITTDGDVLSVHFTQSSISQEDSDALTAVVAAHTGQTTVGALSDYLNSVVNPFCEELVNAFAAENISMGITQAGKTGHVLAMFTKKVPVPSEAFKNNLKTAFDTGSLYVAVSVIQYFRDNPSEYDGLSPYITDARLLQMKNKVEAFLGLPLST